jgi:hypothetical protein
MILPDKDFREFVRETADTVWYIGRTPIRARNGGGTYYPQRLFVRGVPQEIEEFLYEEFGGITPLSSLGFSLYRDSVSVEKTGRRYGAFLRSCQIPMAGRLLLGGREFVLPGEYRGMIHIDRNSAYPAIAVDMELPTPYFTRLRQNVSPQAAERLVRTQTGFGEFRMVLTETIPCQGCLPVKRGTYQYPRGAGELVTGTWTFNEIAYAMEWGYRIRKAFWLWACPVDYPYLSDVQKQLYAARRKHQGGLGETIYKAIANKLIGRLAMKPATITVKQRGRTKNFTPPVLSNRLHAAYVIAEQRIAMHKAITGAVDPVYAFTDSLVCGGLPDVQIGGGLGEWKVFPRSEDGVYRVKGRGQYSGPGRSANRGGK